MNPLQEIYDYIDQDLAVKMSKLEKLKNNITEYIDPDRLWCTLWCAISVVLGFYFYEWCENSTKNTFIHAKYEPGSELKRKEKLAINSQNDATLIHYINQYNILRDEFARNIDLLQELKSFYFNNQSVKEAQDILFGSKLYYNDEYFRVTGKKWNQTVGDYHKLLERYERDSIDARYRQLREQTIIAKHNKMYRAK